jgi:hypothetical protein
MDVGTTIVAATAATGLIAALTKFLAELRLWLKKGPRSLTTLTPWCSVYPTAGSADRLVRLQIPCGAKLP